MQGVLLLPACGLGAIIVSDFLTKIIHPNFDELAMIGKKADVKP
jgi:hypothetical protein